MKYVIIGAGGTGGAIGGFLSRAGKDTTLIARGPHLTAMQKKGLHFETPDGAYTVPVKACSMEEYQDTPDIIFVCVKGYSLEETIPFIRRIAASHTIVIPILNIYGTGGKLQEKLPELAVTDGCIYIAAQITAPGTILLSGKIFRVVYGLRKDTPAKSADALMPILETVLTDLNDADITPTLSSQIEIDALQKFSFVSPMAALGTYCDITAQDVQTPGEYRTLFLSLIREVRAISVAMGTAIPANIEGINLGIMDALAPEATTSMQRDIKAGKPSEVDGLVYEVVRLGKQFGVEVPIYEKIAEELKARGL